MKPQLFLTHIAALSFLLFAFIGCSGGGPATLEGAWLGEGEFHAGAGTQEVEAQLEILSDGTYRFLILKPGIMALAGMEQGTWTDDGATLDLQPVDDAEDRKPSVLFGSAPRNFRPKSLTIGDGMKALSLQDGPLTMEFRPNPKATKKLKASGDVK